MRAAMSATRTMKLPSGSFERTSACIDWPSMPPRARWKACWRGSPIAWAGAVRATGERDN
jgi:hypothetical protein